MDSKELQNIINQLETDNLKDNAYFGIFEYGGGPDESFIRANQQGLRYFAIELLKAARDRENYDKRKSDKEVFNLGIDEDWIDNNSKTFIHYVETTNEIRKNVKVESSKVSWKDQIMKFGCLTAILIAVISIIVGIITIINWVT